MPKHDVAAPVRLVLDRPVRLTARAAYPGPANPFERQNFGIPLLLVLHTNSLESLTGTAREDAEMLVSLAYSPYTDVWLTWGEQSFGEALSYAKLETSLDEQGLRNLPIRVSYSSGTGGLRTALSDWWQWPQHAQQLYGDDERAQKALDAYAGALLTRSTKRHLFVTAENTLLAERGEQPWTDVNIVTVREALALVGLLMRQRGHCDLFYDETGPFETSDTARFYLQLTEVLASNAWHLADVVEAARQASEATYDLLLSAQDRINDLLVARDEIRVATLLPHGGGMLASVLYHLRAAVQTAAALFDSVAVLACEHLHIQVKERQRASFRQRPFRKSLTDAGGTDLAAIVGDQRYLALAAFVNALRGPIGHGRGLHGITNPTAEVVISRVRISPEQAEKIKQVCGQRQESPEAWGIHDGQQPSLDADTFCDRFVRTVIEAFDETLRALTADIRRLHPGDSPLIEAWREGNARVEGARAAMPADQRAELERDEAAQQQAQLREERVTIRQLVLYAGLADWQLLSHLNARRTESDPNFTPAKH